MVSHICALDKDVSFVFLGQDNSGGELKKKLSELKLDKRVRCLGFSENVSRELGQAKLFVLPSLWNEGCPTSILEAFEANTPVLAFSIDGIPEMIVNNMNGFLVEPYDYKKMRSVILNILNNKVSCEQIVVAAQKKLKSEFSLLECSINHDFFFYKIFENRGFRQK